ncbi:MAG: type II secretion system protein [Armatimonadota bacterium]
MMRQYRQRGFTLTEVLITIAVLSLVMALLGFPLLSAFGYIQKATARGEARRAGFEAAKKLSAEVGTAMYVFELPPDGSALSLLHESSASDAKSLGMPMDFSENVTLVRYMRVLDFPWIKDSSTNLWDLLKPNYLTAQAYSIYDIHWAPYHMSEAVGKEPNPYILARYQETMSWDRAWGSAVNVALSGSYPMNDTARYPTNARKDELLRQFRNEMIAITPYGGDHDVPRFSATPLRVGSEALTMQVDAHGRKNPTVFASRYPLWAGRSADIDQLTDAQLQTLYGQNLATMKTVVDAQSYKLYPLGVNPYGYQIRVFDSTGGLVAGTAYYDATANNYTTMATERHFMDWPPIDRPDWTDWQTNTALWGLDDIMRQRLEGKVVFAEPMRTTALTVQTVAGQTIAVLPIPGSWDGTLTYLTSTPPQIVWNGNTFRLVKKQPGALGDNEYCRLNPAVSPSDSKWTSATDSRTLVFGAGMTANGNIAISPITYTICDLQPTDVVVATYSTKAVLDIALTVSRKDRAGRSPKESRQDYPVNLRVEARNAIKRARDNQ